MKGNMNGRPKTVRRGISNFNKEWYDCVLEKNIDYCCIKGYPYNGAVSELYIGNGGKEYTNCYYVVQDGKKEYQDVQYEYSGIPARGMDTSYEDAKKFAEDAIYNLYGEEMAHVQTDLSNANVVDENWVSAQKGKLDDTCPQCYVFHFYACLRGACANLCAGSSQL